MHVCEKRVFPGCGGGSVLLVCFFLPGLGDTIVGQKVNGSIDTSTQTVTEIFLLVIRLARG